MHIDCVNETYSRILIDFIGCIDNDLTLVELYLNKLFIKIMRIKSMSCSKLLFVRKHS